MADVKAKKGKLSEAEKREQVKEALLKKKQYEKRALEIVHSFIECPQSGDCLISSALQLNQHYYDDIVTERSLVKLCGYPVCSSTLGKIPKAKYHISLKDKKVYELEERVKFCSNFCYKASCFYRNQLDTSPFWLRSATSVAPVKLLQQQQPPTAAGKSVAPPTLPGKGEVVDFSADLARLTLADASLKGPGDSDEVEVLVQDGEIICLPVIGETSSHLAPRSSDGGTEMAGKASATSCSVVAVKKRVAAPLPPDPAEVVVKALNQWVTKETGVFLFPPQESSLPEGGTAAHGDEDDNDSCDEDDADKELSEDLSSQLVLAEEANKKRLEEEEENEIFQAKFNAYIHGREVYEEEIKRKAVVDKEDDSVEPRLPLLDRHAQTSLRIRIVLEGIARCLPEVIKLFHLTLADLRPHLRELVQTFHLAPDTITFRPSEWRLLVIFIMLMLAYRVDSVKCAVHCPGGEQTMDTLLHQFHLDLASAEKTLDDIILSKNPPSDENVVD